MQRQSLLLRVAQALLAHRLLLALQLLLVLQSHLLHKPLSYRRYEKAFLREGLFLYKFAYPAHYILL